MGLNWFISALGEGLVCVVMRFLWVLIPSSVESRILLDYIVLVEGKSVL